MSVEVHGKRFLGRNHNPIGIGHISQQGDGFARLDLVNGRRQALIVSLSNGCNCIVRCQASHRVHVIFLFHAHIAIPGEGTHITGKSTAGNLRRRSVCRSVHRAIRAREAAAGNGQLSLVHRQTAVTTVDHSPLIRVERAATDAGYIPVHHRVLCHVFKDASGNRQITIIVVFNGVDPAGKGATVNGQLGISLICRFFVGLSSSCTVLPAVGH